MAGLITVNPQQVESEMARHLGEYKRLKRFLRQLQEFGTSGSLKSKTPNLKTGRPKKASPNPYVVPLREFIESQRHQFNHRDLKSVVGDDARKDHLRQSLKILEKEGILRVIEKPMGRFPGLYERSERQNGKTADRLFGPAAASQ